MIRKVPDSQRGQRSISMANTRLRKSAPPRRDETGRATASMPGWRDVGGRAPRSWRIAANKPYSMKNEGINTRKSSVDGQMCWPRRCLEVAEILATRSILCA